MTQSSSTPSRRGRSPKLHLAPAQVWEPAAGTAPSAPREIIEVGSDPMSGPFVVFRPLPNGRSVRTQRSGFLEWYRLHRATVLEVRQAG